MTAYKKYPRYKNSGVEWLGDVPEHWEVLRFSRLYNLRMGETILAEELQDFGDLPVYSATERDSVFGYTSSHKPLLNYGDLVIPARGVSIGSVKLVRTKATATQTTIIATSPNKRVNPIFGYYWSIGHRSELFDYDHTAIPQITVAQIRAKPFPLPPLAEQHAIAEYLDRETAALDALIEKKERLMELLEEKRQALISHAVTKGLNPNAPMKDSGVEWLGEVPAHWEVVPSYSLFKTQKGTKAALLTNEYCSRNPGPYAVYSGQTSNDGVMSRIDSYEFSLEQPVVISTTVGAKAMSVGWTELKISLSQNCMIFIPVKNVHSRYFYYLFLIGFPQLRALIPDHMQPSFRMEDFYGMRLWIPPVNEQVRVAQFLDQETQNINVILTTTRRSIDLLKEKRSALITAVVTGQVDVRDEVA